MDRHELDRASSILDNLKRAEIQRDALLDRKIVGIVVDRADGNGSLSPVRIERGGNSGGGSISSIGFESDMETVLTQAMHDLFQRRVDALRDQLKSYGVQIDEAA